MVTRTAGLKIRECAPIRLYSYLYFMAAAYVIWRGFDWLSIGQPHWCGNIVRFLRYSTTAWVDRLPRAMGVVATESRPVNSNASFGMMTLTTTGKVVYDNCSGASDDMDPQLHTSTICGSFRKQLTGKLVQIDNLEVKADFTNAISSIGCPVLAVAFGRVF